MYKLCQAGGNYWEAWERGRGPGQVKPPQSEAQLERAKRIKANTARTQRLKNWIAFFRLPEEQGLGDTLQRLLAVSGRRSITNDLKNIKRTCACNPEQAIKTLNANHPYT
jgi:hypothetical protein